MSTETDTAKQLAPESQEGCDSGSASVIAWPSDDEKLLVEVFHQDGDPAFICGIHGWCDAESIGSIEREVNASPEDYFEHGEGAYLFSAWIDTSEDDSYWDLTLIDYRALPECPLCGRTDNHVHSIE